MKNLTVCMLLGRVALLWLALMPLVEPFKLVYRITSVIWCCIITILLVRFIYLWIKRGWGFAMDYQSDTKDATFCIITSVVGIIASKGTDLYWYALLAVCLFQKFRKKLPTTGKNKV